MRSLRAVDVAAAAGDRRDDAQLVARLQRGLEVVEVDKDSFRDALLKNVPVETMGFTRADYDRIQKLR